MGDAAAHLLEEAARAGLRLYLKPDGSPAVAGSPVPPPLFAQLKRHREAVVAALRYRDRPAVAPRRAVLLAEDGTAEQSFDGLNPRAHHQALRDLAARFPGRTLAGEWRKAYPDGREEWVRFVTISPAPEGDAP